MVTNDEITQRLRNKREGISNHGYLVCDTCHSYYKLKPGEKIQDFDCNCDCGGTLEYFDYFPYSDDNGFDNESTSDLVYIGYLSIVIFAFAAIIIGIILYKRGGRDKSHGIIILAITSVLVLPILLISILLIYRAYA